MNYYKIEILNYDGISAIPIYESKEDLIGKYNYVIVKYNGYNRLGRIKTKVPNPGFFCKDILKALDLTNLKLDNIGD